MTVYAGENKDYVIAARCEDRSIGSFVQICLPTQTAESCKTVGLELSTSNHLSVWTCPDRPGLPMLETGEYNQWNIGYQYFGGITNWFNSSFEEGIPGRSPVRLANQNRRGAWRRTR